MSDSNPGWFRYLFDLMSRRRLTPVAMEGSLPLHVFVERLRRWRPEDHDRPPSFWLDTFSVLWLLPACFLVGTLLWLPWLIPSGLLSLYAFRPIAEWFGVDSPSALLAIDMTAFVLVAFVWAKILIGFIRREIAQCPPWALIHTLLTVAGSRSPDMSVELQSAGSIKRIILPQLLNLVWTHRKRHRALLIELDAALPEPPAPPDIPGAHLESPRLLALTPEALTHRAELATWLADTLGVRASVAPLPRGVTGHLKPATHTPESPPNTTHTLALTEPRLALTPLPSGPPEPLSGKRIARLTGLALTAVCVLGLFVLFVSLSWHDVQVGRESDGDFVFALTLSATWFIFGSLLVLGRWNGPRLRALRLPAGEERTRTLTLTHDTITLDGDAPITLDSPFRVQLSRSEPEAGDATPLHVEVRQDARRVAFTVWVETTDDLETLPHLERRTPVVQSADEAALLWRALAFYAEAHGEPMRWSLER